MKKIYIVFLLSMFINSDEKNSAQCNLYTDNVMGGKSTLKIYTDDVMGGKSTLEEKHFEESRLLSEKNLSKT